MSLRRLYERAVQLENALEHGFTSPRDLPPGMIPRRRDEGGFGPDGNGLKTIEEFLNDLKVAGAVAFGRNEPLTDEELDEFLSTLPNGLGQIPEEAELDSGRAVAWTSALINHGVYHQIVRWAAHKRLTGETR